MVELCQCTAGLPPSLHTPRTWCIPREFENNPSISLQVHDTRNYAAAFPSQPKGNRGPLHKLEVANPQIDYHSYKTLWQMVSNLFFPNLQGVLRFFCFNVIYKKRTIAPKKLVTKVVNRTLASSLQSLTIN